MRYISDSVISFSVQIGGRDKRVRFSPVMDGGSSYITNDVDEIKALESLSSFQRGVFRRAPGSEKEVVRKADSPAAKGKAGRPKKGDPKEELIPVNDVTTWQEAAEYLVEKCGSEALAEPDAILEEAGKKGVSFPNLK